MKKVNINVTKSVDTICDIWYYVLVTKRQQKKKGCDKMLDAKEIGYRLRKLRGDTSRSIVADAIGISVSAISMYENGERIPRDIIKVELASYYGKSVQEIFFDKNCHV